jgi:hypothetical protein
MSIERYFNKAFRQDIGKLCFRPVPQVVKDIFHDPALVLFGGPGWENVKADLQDVPDSDLPQFVLCLFAVVLTDQCMHRYFKPSYARWRADTQYPKFGWNRFGLFNENPLQLLAVPEQAGLLDAEAVLALMPEFLVFYKKLVSDYLQRHLPHISPDQFFSALLQDDIMNFNVGSLVGAFRQLALQQWAGHAVQQNPLMGPLAAV